MMSKLKDRNFSVAGYVSRKEEKLSSDYLQEAQRDRQTYEASYLSPCEGTLYCSPRVQEELSTFQGLRALSRLCGRHHPELCVKQRLCKEVH
jgi:hypothetical protein